MGLGRGREGTLLVLFSLLISFFPVDPLANAHAWSAPLPLPGLLFLSRLFFFFPPSFASDSPSVSDPRTRLSLSPLARAPFPLSSSRAFGFISFPFLLAVFLFFLFFSLLFFVFVLSERQAWGGLEARAILPSLYYFFFPLDLAPPRSASPEW